MATDDTASPKDQTNKEAKEPESKAEVSDNSTSHKISSDKPKPTNKFARLWQAYKAKKKLSIPLTVVIVIILILAIPFSRYKILGLAIKRQFAVVIVDSQTNKPVSDAEVTLAGHQAKTDNQGRATVTAKVGSSKLLVTKKYYTDYSHSVLVALHKAANPLQVKLQATGRQVPVKILNKITGKPVENATIGVAGTQAHTDKNGTVTIVLPADKSTLGATLTANGYNDAKATVQITDQQTTKNNFTIVPTGKLYFLSKATGTIDVVKTDLDGSNRQTVLAGTGNEDDQNTVLLATRDWKYLALLSRRDTTGNAQLNLIDTSNDQLTNIDKGNATFGLSGWIDHSFVYTVNRNGLQVWQPKQVALKSFNADSKQLSTIDETQAAGSDQSNYAVENISWINELGGKIVYFKTWTGYDSDIYSYGVAPQIAGKQAEIISADPSGSKTTVKSFALNVPSGSSYYNPLSSYNTVQYRPDEIFFTLNNDQGGVSYDKYENGQLSEDDKESADYFSTSEDYPTYLASPSGNQTFWSEARDGKNTLFVGDNNGSNGKQIANLSELTPYGWYTNDYLLVSKDSSELYIMPVAGGTPLKVSDYHKPVRNFSGYGGGYGGF